jgi:hypothetical protein
MSNASHPSRVICPGADLPASIVVDDILQVHSCSRLLPGTTCNVDCNLQLSYTALDLDAFLQKHGQQPCSRCHRPITAEDWYDSRLTVANSCSTPLPRSNLLASSLISAGSASCCAALPLPGDISLHRNNHQLPLQEYFPCRPNPRGTDKGTGAAYRIRVRFSSNFFMTIYECVIKPNSYPQCWRAKRRT